MNIKIFVCPLIAILLVGAVAAQQTPFPDLPDDVFAVDSDSTSHLAKANDHLKEAGKAMAWCDMHLREAVREFSLASALKLKSATKTYSPPNPLSGNPRQGGTRPSGDPSPHPALETVSKAG